MDKLELAKEVERIYNEGFYYKEAFYIVENIFKLKKAIKSDL